MASERVQRQIDRLLDEAEEAIAQLDWRLVQSRAQAVLALDTANPDAINYLAAADRGLDGDAARPPGQRMSELIVPPDHASTQPSSFANGRYEVQRFLGEGGKKKVYLAHATTLDRDVAFALIKTEGLDETSRTRIRREAQAWRS